MGEEVTARVIKIDRADRRIGLSIKAANYSQEQLKEEEAVLDALKPGEDLVALQHAFDNFGDEGEGGSAEPEAPTPPAEEAKEEETEAPADSKEAPAEAEVTPESAEEAPAEEEAKADEAKSDE